MRIFVLLLALVLLPSVARADYFDGNSLKQLMDSQRPQDVGMYRGYIAGVQDDHNGVLFCVHPDVRLNQAAAIVSKYFSVNPQLWHLPAKQLVIDALSQSFPCRK